MAVCKFYMSKNRRKFYENTLENKKKELTKKIKEVDNGIILPATFDNSANPKLWAIGGVVDEKFHFIDESSSGYLFGGNYEVNEDFVNYVDEEVIFFGPFIQHWGHFICDQISRLWYIIDNPEKYKIAYCGWNWEIGNSEIYGNYLELIELLGIKKEQLINVKEPTKFKKVIIPEFSFVGGQYYSNEFECLIEKLIDNTLHNINIDCPKKIYFSRMKLGSNKEHGEDKIVEILENNGFKILYPEQLSLKEQIIYFNRAEVVSMISGSIAHNLIFSKSKNNAIIFNKIGLINNYQTVVDQVAHANIYYVDSYFSILPVLFGEGPFLLRINNFFKKYLKDFDLKYKNVKNNNFFKELLWYLKKWFITYKNPTNRSWLIDQTKSIKKQK